MMEQLELNMIFVDRSFGGFSAKSTDGTVVVSLPFLRDLKRNKQVNELGRILIHELIISGRLEREF
jgi:hypothetical protein